MEEDMHNRNDLSCMEHATMFRHCSLFLNGYKT